MRTANPTKFPFDNFSQEELFSLLVLAIAESAKKDGTSELWNILHMSSKFNIQHLFNPYDKKCEERHKDLSSLFTKISHMLAALGIPANLLGYEYLRYAIFMSVQDRDNLSSITKTLYPAIAEKYQTNTARVERAMRHAIEVSCNRSDPETFHSVFGNTLNPDRGKPTNSEFISKISDILRMDYD